MRILHALLGEHGVLYAQFRHLEEALPEADSLGEVKAQAAILGAALATHAQLEEELLFRALDPHLGGGGPLAVMRMEHEQIEGALEKLATAEELETAREQLLGVVDVAQHHFAKEEQVLFPMASQVLSEEALMRLGSQWAESRSVVVA